MHNLSYDDEELLSVVPNLRALARSLTRDHEHAEDLVQETLLRALTYRHQFNVGTNLRAWLCRILRNAFYSDLRRDHNADDIEDWSDRLVQLPDQFARLDWNDFKKAFEALVPDQREAIFLVGVEGLKYDEVAELCGVSVGTVKSRMHRARERLSTILGYHQVSPIMAALGQI
jgi:RNA polymerase sigma-70 factor (ECF subfamily)